MDSLFYYSSSLIPVFLSVFSVSYLSRMETIFSCHFVKVYHFFFIIEFCLRIC